MFQKSCTTWDGEVKRPWGTNQNNASVTTFKTPVTLEMGHQKAKRKQFDNCFWCGYSPKFKPVSTLLKNMLVKHCQIGSSPQVGAKIKNIWNYHQANYCWFSLASHAWNFRRMLFSKQVLTTSHTIHVWYIYLHLVDFYGKCREIYHTWILWAWQFSLTFIQ